MFSKELRTAVCAEMNEKMKELKALKEERKKLDETLYNVEERIKSLHDCMEESRRAFSLDYRVVRDADGDTVLDEGGYPLKQYVLEEVPD